MTKNKNNKKSKTPIIFGGILLLYYLFKAKISHKELQNKNNTNESQNKVTENEEDNIQALKDLLSIQFTENEGNGVSLAVSQKVVPSFVPYSFVISQYEKEYATKTIFSRDKSEKIKKACFKIDFQIQIYLPYTALGYLIIKDFTLGSLKLVKYITPQENKYIDVRNNVSFDQIEILKQNMIGRTVKDGFNIFNISLFLEPTSAEDTNLEELVNYEIEAIYTKFDFATDATNIAKWTVFAAFNVLESTFNIDNLFSSSPFGNFVGVKSTPREYRNQYNEYIKEYKKYDGQPIIYISSEILQNK